jgi:hypothetical protein
MLPAAMHAALRARRPTVLHAAATVRAAVSTAEPPPQPPTASKPRPRARVTPDDLDRDDLDRFGDEESMQRAKHSARLHDEAPPHDL